MKIVLYVNSFLPSVGGREMVVHYLAKAYRELGHDVRIFGASGWLKYRNLDLGYPVFRYPTTRFLPSEETRLLQLLFDITFRGCDVIHAHATYPAGYIAARLKKYKKVPLVITPHGNDIHTIPELGHGLRLDPEKDKKIRYAIKKADLLTAISKSIEASLLDADAEPHKIRLIPNGVDMQRFEMRNAQPVYDWLSIHPSSKLIVTVGKYNPRKGQDVLIKAMPEILKREPMAILVIIGNKTEALIPLIEELGLSGKVILTGAIKPPAVYNEDPADEINVEDKIADIYLQSKMYVSAGVAEGSEGLSLAVLEAMACRLPVVASNISGNRDIVTDKQNGFLVEPGNHEMLAKAVLAILQDDSMQNQMGSKAKLVAEEYKWKKIAEMYLSIYQKALELV